MNLIRQWIESRKLRARAARAAAELELENRKATLRAHVKAARSDLWPSGLKLINGDYYDEDSNYAVFYAITFGGEVIRVMVGIQGAVDIRSIKRHQ